MKRLVATIVAVLIALLLLGACNGFEKLLKSTNSELQYAEAMRYYKKGKYSKALQLFERVLPMVRATSRGDSVFYLLSDCYFREKDYELAGYSFERFIEDYPKSVFVEQATFQSAYCSYKASPRPTLEQSNTLKAIEGFLLFKERYPTSGRLAEVNGYIQQMYEKLQVKAYGEAWLYYRQDKYLAAIFAFKTALERFPNSEYREKEMFYLLKCTYLYAENSIYSKQRERYQKTVDTYLSFLSEYPSSKYAQDAATYYRVAMKALGKTPDESVLPS